MGPPPAPAMRRRLYSNMWSAVASAWTTPSQHVADFMPDPPKATPLVTVRDLLTHASGVNFDQRLTGVGDDDECLAGGIRQGGQRSRVVGEQLIPTMGTPCQSASSDADV
jgi:CubicO group peptidase (beta-lactamase class C family)